MLSAAVHIAALDRHTVYFNLVEQTIAYYSSEEDIWLLVGLADARESGVLDGDLTPGDWVPLRGELKDA